MAEPRWLDALNSQLTSIQVVSELIEKAPAASRAELVPTWQSDLTLMKAATPFAWSKETINAVMHASKSLPLDTKINMWNIDTNAAWWKFDSELPLRTLTENVGVIGLSFGWLTRKDVRHLDEFKHITRADERYIQITAWCPGILSKKVPYMPSQVFRWEEGMTLGEMLDDTRRQHHYLYNRETGIWKDREIIGEDAFMHATETIARFILAGLAWINQRVVVLDTPDTKRFQKKHPKDWNRLLRATNGDVDIVRVVNLRRVDYAKHEPGDDTREFAVRWVVSGHWRNQACGVNLSERRIVWIDPYVKGPEDAPLKVPQFTVYRVAR